MKYKTTLETLREQIEEISNTLDGFGFTNLKLLAEIENPSIILTYNYLLEKDQRLTQANEAEEHSDATVINYLQRRLSLSEQDFEGRLFVLISEGDEVLTDRQKEDLVEYTVENLQELIEQAEQTEIVTTASEASGLDSEEEQKIAEEENSTEESSDEELSNKKRDKEPSVALSTSTSSSPSQSPATKVIRTSSGDNLEAINESSAAAITATTLAPPPSSATER
jgi:hypothetical protein